MKRLLILLTLILLAPSIIDQLNTDFAQGTHQDTQNVSNQLLLAQTAGNYSLSGTYLSSIKDLGSNPTATISWVASIPAQTSLIVTTRSGNTPTPDGTWSSWSTAYANPSGSLLSSPMRRYYQYRLQLATTNNQATPTIDALTLTYTEQGPIIATASSQNAALNTDTTGTYRYHLSIQDTLPLTATQARYRIGTDAYSSYQNLTLDGNYYYIDISTPSGGWASRGGQTLSVNVFAQNNNTQSNETLAQQIVQINQPPVLPVLSNVFATEGQPMNFTVTATDPDGDALTFTSSRGTVTSLSSTSARVTWTPLGSDVPNTTITITVSDGQDTDQATLTAFVSSFNFPPVMQPVSDQSGYYGDRIVFDITVTDQNLDENMTYWVEPRLFRITSIPSNTSGVYRARANFTALDDHRGITNFTFYASDGEHTTSQSAILDIGFCGDNVCQAQENATACPQDCRQAQTRAYVVLEVPDRFCVNQTATVQVYNASSRYSCFLEGRAFQGAAYCDLYQGASITVYELLGQQRQQIQTLTSDAQGQATFTPPRTGRYRFIVEHDDMMPMDQLVTVNDCSLDINLVEEVVEFERPNVPPPQRRPPQTPQVERPDFTPDETSLLAILVWYLIVPLLGAALLYTSSAWYDINKDSNVFLLSARVRVAEITQRLAPKVMPPLRKLWIIVAPVVRPIIVHVYHGVLKPTWNLLASLVNKLRR